MYSSLQVSRRFYSLDYLHHSNWVCFRVIFRHRPSYCYIYFRSIQPINQILIENYMCLIFKLSLPTYIHIYVWSDVCSQFELFFSFICFLLTDYYLKFKFSWTCNGRINLTEVIMAIRWSMYETHTEACSVQMTFVVEWIESSTCE